MRFIALVGWALAGALFVGNRRLIAQMERLGPPLLPLLPDVQDGYRVKLSCPVCNWTATATGADREAAIEIGTAYIEAHNQLMGHILEGTPKTGYFRGEPLN